MRDQRNEITHREIEQVRADLQDGLKEMLQFEQRLRKIDRETLCLFLTLTVDRESYPRVLHLLEELRPLDRQF